jgi:hypothetical protein
MQGTTLCSDVETQEVRVCAHQAPQIRQMSLILQVEIGETPVRPECLASGCSDPCLKHHLSKAVVPRVRLQIAASFLDMRIVIS